MENLIKVAKGEQKADLVLKNANVVNVFNNKITLNDVAIYKGMIAGIAQNYEGIKEIDLAGKYLSPSFIDGHVHIESSMCLPKEFAKAVVPEGTVTVIADPHEISNVFGLHGISFMREACKNLPLQVYMMLPSCVPATQFETSGFDLASYDLSFLIDSPEILGIAEMMNYPGVLNCDKDVMSKLILGKSNHKKIDGHAPNLTGKDLCAYIASGVMSDHECTNVAEAEEKLGLGMHIMIREGSAAKDLQALIPILKENNANRCILVTDDRHPTDLKGHINDMVRKCVEGGVNPISAIKAASFNTACYFGLNNLGAIAPGYRANMLVLNNLKDFKPQMVFKDGKLVAKEGKLITHHTDKAALTLMSLDSVVEKEYVSVNEDMSLGQLVNVISKSNTSFIPVLDNAGMLLGEIDITKIRHIMFRTELYNRFRVRQIMTPVAAKLLLNDPMESVMRAFEKENANYLPVVDMNNHLIGFISRTRVFSMYRKIVSDLSDE